ncbi:hypothetical protein WME79_07570 [Sorangium sp. So ce726]|uniref:hypothetical protein n=1 Tax=Sorangium sp. So ce726 TaxID=3133319 RepID=UPI003F60D2CA
MLVGAFAMTGCGDDDTTGSGGAGGGTSSSTTSSSSHSSSTSSGGGEGGEGGAGGSDGGAGGEGGAGGSDGGAGGEGGEGGAGGGAPDIGPGPGESCSGCARLAVPLTTASTGTLFQFDFAQLADLTGATVTFRVKAQTATGGGLQVFVQNGNAQSWAGVPWAWTSFSDLKDWTDLTIDVDASAAASTTFNKAQVKRIGVKVDAGAEGPWANPTIVYIDSITVTRSASTSGSGGAGGAGGEGGAGGAGGTSGEGGSGGAGGTSGEGGSAGATGEGGAGGTSGEGGSAGATGEGGSAGATGEGGAGGASGEVVNVIGPFEFTDGLQGFLLGDYQPVQGSRLDPLGEE